MSPERPLSKKLTALLAAETQSQARPISKKPCPFCGAEPYKRFGDAWKCGTYIFFEDESGDDLQYEISDQCKNSAKVRL